jgi:hypothetical protein
MRLEVGIYGIMRSCSDGNILGFSRFSDSVSDVPARLGLKKNTAGFGLALA